MARWDSARLRRMSEGAAYSARREPWRLAPKPAAARYSPARWPAEPDARMDARNIARAHSTGDGGCSLFVAEGGDRFDTHGSMSRHPAGTARDDQDDGNAAGQRCRIVRRDFAKLADEQ